MNRQPKRHLTSKSGRQSLWLVADRSRTSPAFLRKQHRVWSVYNTTEILRASVAILQCFALDRIEYNPTHPHPPAPPTAANGRSTATMVLTVHHLSVSQSERIPWLLEELALPYELIVHKRNPENHMGTPAIKSLPGNITGSAPVLIDSTASPSVTLAESGAIIQYILGRYAPDSPLNPQPQDADFASFCDWMHRANGSVMPAAMADLYMNYAKVGADVPIRLRLRDRFFKLAAHADEVLSKGKWICGERFTAADCMLHFAVSFASSFFWSCCLWRGSSVDDVRE